MITFMLFTGAAVAGLTWSVLRWLGGCSPRVTLWCGILFFGYAAMATGTLPHTPLTRVLVNAWALSLLVLPVWWLLRGPRPRGRR